MFHTVRYQRILERAEQIAKEAGLECIDSYCVTKAMLEGNPYNICYLAFINLGLNVERFIEELDRINDMRGAYTQGDKLDPLSRSTDSKHD